MGPCRWAVLATALILAACASATAGSEPSTPSSRATSVPVVSEPAATQARFVLGDVASWGALRVWPVVDRQAPEAPTT